ncbi:MAG: acetyl-CoA carboxylase biotin carboxyl carrier protein [Acidobacteria bacterium]|nr:acetyl-CoA carboxylase biotin carboxyl carrier protein [Acidobacteriota bacterium]MDA1233964.1 acetyl-CoA carboxylase biotin carboxyl carrier protein [Acidobacteriota bacterium]
MNLDHIKELLELIADTDVTELEVQDGDEKIRIRRKAAGADDAPPYVVVTSGMASVAPSYQDALQAPTPGGAAAEPAAPADDDLVMVKSPMVGTFYESASPGSPAFVDIGDTVEKGETLCIIEAMKLMNEIEAEVSGVVAKRFVANGEPIEYGQALFGIRPA